MRVDPADPSYVRFAWSVMPFILVLFPLIVAARLFRRLSICIGGLVGCLFGAMVPEPGMIAEYRNAEDAFLGTLQRHFDHRFTYCALGATIGATAAFLATWLAVRNSKEPSSSGL